MATHAPRRSSFRPSWQRPAVDAGVLLPRARGVSAFGAVRAETARLVAVLGPIVAVGAHLPVAGGGEGGGGHAHDPRAARVRGADVVRAAVDVAAVVRRA